MQNPQIVKSSYGFIVDFSIDSEYGNSLIDRALTALRAKPLPSLGMLQRELDCGYGIAAQVMAELERRGVVSKIQHDGDRRYFGDGAEGRAAFLAFAEMLRAGIEPAAVWWRNLGQTARCKYLPGVAPGVLWGDLSDSDQAKMRGRYFKNLGQLQALNAQFSYKKGAGVSA